MRMIEVIANDRLGRKGALTRLTLSACEMQS